MIVNQSLDEVIQRPEIIVSDWDGVIQFIDRAWVWGVAQRQHIFEEYYDLTKLRFGQQNFIEELVGRKEYYLDKWLLKDPTKPVPAEIQKEFMSIYLDDPNFYNNCNFLGMANHLITMAHQEFCKEIIFLTHVPTAEGKDERKERIFEEYFASESNKFRLVTIPHDKPKWEWIKENQPDYTCFIDDRFDIIKDVVMNTDSNKKTYLMPFLGYNEHFQEDLEFIQIVDIKGSSFSTYYNSFLKG